MTDAWQILDAQLAAAAHAVRTAREALALARDEHLTAEEAQAQRLGLVRALDAGAFGPPPVQQERLMTTMQAHAMSAYPESRTWRPPDPDREPAGAPFRTCGYCGSIHPADLLDAFTRHPLRLELADMKYGWPHKVYVEGIPNPVAGRQVEVGSQHHTGGYPQNAEQLVAEGSARWETVAGRRTLVVPRMAPAAATTWAKFYTEHLTDAADGFDTLADRLASHIRVRFTRDHAGRLMWAEDADAATL